MHTSYAQGGGGNSLGLPVVKHRRGEEGDGEEDCGAWARDVEPEAEVLDRRLLVKRWTYKAESIKREMVWPTYHIRHLPWCLVLEYPVKTQGERSWCVEGRVGCSKERWRYSITCDVQGIVRSKTMQASSFPHGGHGRRLSYTCPPGPRKPNAIPAYHAASAIRPSRLQDR